LTIHPAFAAGDDHRTIRMLPDAASGLGSPKPGSPERASLGAVSSGDTGAPVVNRLRRLVPREFTGLRSGTPQLRQRKVGADG